MTAEFRKKAIKTRQLEISAILKRWKQEFFDLGKQRTMLERTTLEAEYADLALEYTLIEEAAKKARAQRKIDEDASLLKQLVNLLNERGLSCLVDEAKIRSDNAKTLGNV